MSPCVIELSPMTPCARERDVDATRAPPIIALFRKKLRLSAFMLVGTLASCDNPGGRAAPRYEIGAAWVRMSGSKNVSPAQDEFLPNYGKAAFNLLR